MSPLVFDKIYRGSKSNLRSSQVISMTTFLYHLLFGSWNTIKNLTFMLHFQYNSFIFHLYCHHLQKMIRRYIYDWRIFFLCWMWVWLNFFKTALSLFTVLVPCFTSSHKLFGVLFLIWSSAIQATVHLIAIYWSIEHINAVVLIVYRPDLLMEWVFEWSPVNSAINISKYFYIY